MILNDYSFYSASQNHTWYSTALWAMHIFLKGSLYLRVGNLLQGNPNSSELPRCVTWGSCLGTAVARLLNCACSWAKRRQVKGRFLPIVLRSWRLLPIITTCETHPGRKKEAYIQWGKHGRQAMRVGIRLFADTADTVFSHPDLISQLGSDEGSRHSEVNFSITLITSISLAGCCHLFTFIMLGRLGKEEENCIPRKSSKAICILEIIYHWPFLLLSKRTSKLSVLFWLVITIITLLYILLPFIFYHCVCWSLLITNHTLQRKMEKYTHTNIEISFHFLFCGSWQTEL